MLKGWLSVNAGDAQVGDDAAVVERPVRSVTMTAGGTESSFAEALEPEMKRP